MATLNEEKDCQLLQRLQTYVPFLKDMIDNRLKADMPQYKKIVALHDMITDRKRKFRYETLKKCEEVIIKMQTKTNYRHAKTDSAKVTPRSPSPAREVVMVDAIPTIRSPDPESWNSIIDQDSVSGDRYTNEKPSVYSTAAETVGRPKSIFDRLGGIVPELDTSKPPISVADLELLKDDGIPGETENTKPQDNEATNVFHIKPPSKVSLVPTPLNKQKHIRVAPPIERKPSIVEKKEKIVNSTDSVFGNLLSSLDDKILVDQKKRRNSRDGVKVESDKIKINFIKDKAKSPLASSVKQEPLMNDLIVKPIPKMTLEEPVKSVSEDEEKQTRLAYKYKPKPKKRNDEMPNIDLVNQIIKEMDKSAAEEVKIPFLESPEPIVQKTDFELKFQPPPELTPEPMALESSFSSSENNSVRFSPPPPQVWEPPSVFPSVVPPPFDYQFHKQSPNQFTAQSPAQFVPPSPNPFAGQSPNYNFQPRAYPAFCNPHATPNIFNSHFPQRPPFVRPQIQAPGRAFTPYEPIKSEYEEHPKDFYPKPQHSFPASKRGNLHHGNFDRGRFNFRENEPHMTYKSWREGKESRDPRLCRREEDNKEDESRFARAKSRERDDKDIRLNRARSRERFEEDKREEKSRDPRFNRAKSRDRFEDKDDSRFERSTSRNRFERAKSRDRFEESRFDRSKSRERFDNDRFARAKSRDRSQSPDRRRAKSVSRDESKSSDSRKDRRRSPTDRDSRSPPKSKLRSRHDKSYSSRNSKTPGSSIDRIYKDKLETNLKNFKIPKKQKPEEPVTLVDESSNSSQSSGPVAADSTVNPPSPKQMEVESSTSTLDPQDRKCEPESTTPNEPEKKNESEQVAKDAMLDMLKTQVGGIAPTELQKFMTMFSQMFSGLIAGKDIASLVAEFAAPKTETSEASEAIKEETKQSCESKEQTPKEETENEEKIDNTTSSENVKVSPPKKNKTKVVVVKKKTGPKPKPKSALKHMNLKTRSSVAERIKLMKRTKKLPPTPPRRTRRSELDKLHQDIKETMGDEVLSTAPKRSCTIHNEVAPSIEASSILEKGRSLRVVLQKIDVRRQKRGIDTVKSPETSPLLKRKSLTKAAEAIASLIDTMDSPEELDLKKDDAEVEADKSDVVAESESEVSVSDKVEEEIELDNKSKKKKRKSNTWASGFIKKKKLKAKADDVPAIDEQHITEETCPSEESTTPVASSDQVPFIDPDKNYYLKFKAQNQCKLCNFRGTSIVNHYVMSHPKSDVAISRLSPKETEAALKSADDENLLANEPTNIRKRKLCNYLCRFCNFTLTGVTIMKFYDHVSMHTGEYRNKCKFCPFKNNYRKSIIRHIDSQHADDRPEKIGDGIITEKGPDVGNIVFGFVCSECNFLQLKQASVEEHVQIYHLSKSACVKKINMSALIEESPTKEIEQPDDDESNNSDAVENESVKLSETLETPEVAKDPDLTVFMCNNDIVEEEENVMEKRLEKMNEIQESIKMQRTSFVDKLQSRLETEQESSSPVIEPVQEQPVVEVSTKDTITKDITMPVLEAATNDTPPSVPKPKERQAVEPITLPETAKPKTDIVGSIVNRLQDQLNKQTPPSTPEITVQPSKANKVSAYNMEAVLEPGKAPIFVCKNPVCIFKTETRKIFEKHCSLTHKSEQNLLSCYSCDDKRTLPMIDIFKHMCLHVDDELSKAEITSSVVSKQTNDVPPANPETTSSEPTTENVVKETEPEEAKYSFKITNVQSLAPPKNQPTALSVLPELPPLIPFSLPVSMSDVSPLITPVPKTMTATQKQPEPQYLLVATPGTKFVVSKPAAITKIVPLTATECKKMRKSATVLEQWLHPESLEMPFKCPYFECAFATHTEADYDVHITTHVFDEYIPCLYCNFKMKIESMKNHVLMRHVHCSYGCAYCLYRAISADYIQIHQETLHQGKAIKTVKFTIKESVRRVASPPPPLIRNILKPYKCKCGKEYILKDNYEHHVVQCKQAKSGAFFACSVCSVLTKRVRTVTQHFTTHGIYEYHCRYCPFGGLQAKDVLNHIALQHPHQYAVIIWRQLQKSAENQGHEEDDTIFDQLCIIQDNYEKSEPTLLPPVLNTPLLLSPTSLALITASTTQPIILNSTLLPVTPAPLPNSVPAVTQPLSNVPLTESPTKNLSASTPPPIIQIPSSAEITNKVLAALSPEKVSVEEKGNSDLPYDDSDDFTTDSANEGSKTSGLIGKDLFKCNSCKNMFLNSNLMKTHLLKCIMAEGKARPYICIHCSKCFKTAANLVDHIRIHGTQRFGCSLCSYKHSHPWHLRTHMKTKHKITNCNIVPVEPGKKNMDTDEFLARPSLQRRTSTVDSPAKETSTDLAATASPNIKTHYCPQEANELPPKSIYSTEVFCSVCNFGTKVRMNLVRHFGLHLNNESVPIPATAPVNPVPCLEKNELMFDKMTNLALSSHSSGRMGAKPEKNNTIEPAETSVPVFVPSNKRYVCGANNCNYLCLEESMLRHHLQALHMQEQTYICSHCKDNLSTEKGNINVDAILSHLRFHDAVLYMCGYCNMLSNVKSKLEKHCFEKHPDQPQKVITVREQETETEAIVSVEKPEKEKKRPWRCGMCKGKFSGRTEAAFHAKSKHGINSQYKCSFCDYKSDDKETFPEHFDNTHKGFSINMIVVFYKEDGEAKLSEAEQSDPFDTTPLWVRNKDNVKHIRGILLDQYEKLPKKSPIKLAPFTTFEKRTTPTKATISNLELSIDAVAKGSGVPPKKPGRRPKKPDLPKLDIETSTSVATLPSDKSDKLIGEQNNATQTTEEKKIPVTVLKEEKIENNDVIEIPDSPTKELTPKIQKSRKNVTTEDLSFVDLQKMPVRKLLDGNFMGTYGPYGKPNKTKFFCPLCATFEHKTSVVFENHLCEELKYERYICNLCEYKSVTGKMLQKHFSTTHNNQKMVHIKPLEPNMQIEDWIRKQVLYQERLINHYVLKAGGKISVTSEVTPIKNPKLPEEKNQSAAESGDGNCDNGIGESSKDESLLVPMSTEEVKISKPAAKKKCNYFRCTRCNLTFMTRALLTNHSMKEHPTMNIGDVEKFHCPKCSAMFQKSWTLQIHLRKKHPETPINTKLTARKSTSAFKPVIKTVARKSTTQVNNISGPQTSQSVSYYMCKPDITEEELKRVHTTVPVMNNYITMNIVQLSKLFNLFPSVNVVDCKDEL